MAEAQTQLDVYKEWLGIPEGERPPDYYQLLRLVRFEDDVEKIRKNYTKLNAHVRKYATGQYSVRSQELLNELARAMLCLTDPERKREYDESLGRVFEEKPGERKPLEQVLVEQGHIAPEQRKEAEQFAEARGLSMRDAVVQMKLVDQETATKALAQELGLSFIDLNETIPDDSVLDRVPRNVVKRNSILPLFVDDDMLLVAGAHEPTPEIEEELRLRFGVPMRAVLATPLAINQAIAKFYAPGARDEAAAEEASPAPATKKAAKSRKPARSAAGPRPRMSQLSPEEQYQRKLMGILVICWSIIGTVLLIQFALKPLVSASSFFASTTMLVLLPLVVGGAAAFSVYRFYWK